MIVYKCLHRTSLIFTKFSSGHIYGDIICDNSSNATLSQMIESVQYNATLSITGAIHGSSREKLYQELLFQSLHERRWYRELCFYYKIWYNNCPIYLSKLLPTVGRI